MSAPITAHCTGLLFVTSQRCIAGLLLLTSQRCIAEAVVSYVTTLYCRGCLLRYNAVLPGCCLLRHNAVLLGLLFVTSQRCIAGAVVCYGTMLYCRGCCFYVTLPSLLGLLLRYRCRGCLLRRDAALTAAVVTLPLPTLFLRYRFRRSCYGTIVGMFILLCYRQPDPSRFGEQYRQYPQFWEVSVCGGFVFLVSNRLGFILFIRIVFFFHLFVITLI